MIELRILEQLDAFSTLGTLSKAAEYLHTSQPALSRSMKTLEDELGVILFERSKNHLALNETGKKAAEYAHQLLLSAEDFENRVIAFDKSLRTISVGFCAPMPQRILTPIFSNYFSGMTLAFDMKDDEDFPEALERHAYQLAVMHKSPEEDRFYSKKIGHEELYISLVPQHPLAGRKTLSLKDLEGLSILLLQDIGFWARMHQQKTPNSVYLKQQDQLSFLEIARNSPYPIFASGHTIKRGDPIPSRVNIPLEDPEARTDYYLVCLKEDQEKYKDLFRHVNSATID